MKKDDLRKNYVQVTHPLKDKERVEFWKSILESKSFTVYLEETPDGVIVWRKKMEGESIN